MYSICSHLLAWGNNLIANWNKPIMCWISKTAHIENAVGLPRDFADTLVVRRLSSIKLIGPSDSEVQYEHF